MELCEIIQYFKCEREMCADCKLNCNALFGLVHAQLCLYFFQLLSSKWNFDKLIIDVAVNPVQAANGLTTLSFQLHIRGYQKRDIKQVFLFSSKQINISLNVLPSVATCSQCSLDPGNEFMCGVFVNTTLVTLAHHTSGLVCVLVLIIRPRTS